MNALTPITYPEEFRESFQLGLQAQDQGEWLIARTHYSAALATLPSSAACLNNLATVVYQLGDLAEAERLYRQALASDSVLPENWCNLGHLLSSQLRWNEAETALEQGRALAPSDPLILSNLTDVLLNLGKLKAAEAAARRALWLSPGHTKAHVNLGMVYWAQGRLAQAQAEFEVAIALNPRLATARSNLGMLQLLQGSWGPGWGNYDWRFAADKRPHRPWGTLPFWTGQQLLLGQELIAWSEQGIGDEVLQASLARETAERVWPGTLVWECDPRLVSLLQRSISGVTFIPREDSPVSRPAASHHIPAWSLGHFTTMEARGQFIRPDPARVAELRARLNLASGERLIGLSWRSENREIGERKSTVLADWAEVLATPGCRFVSLQYGEREEASGLLHLDGLDLRNDLESLAALAACCDLVLTVSNITAHIAGALGLPTWVLAPLGSGHLWYWGTGENTPWYPSVRMLRQTEPGDWTAAIARTTTELNQFVRGGTATPLA